MNTNYTIYFHLSNDTYAVHFCTILNGKKYKTWNQCTNPWLCSLSDVLLPCSIMSASLMRSLTLEVMGFVPGVSFVATWPFSILNTNVMNEATIITFHCQYTEFLFPAQPVHFRERQSSSFALEGLNRGWGTLMWSRLPKRSGMKCNNLAHIFAL